MLIALDGNLTHSSVGKLLKKHYQTSLPSPEIIFDWRAVTWAGLPELVTLLNWSSKLAETKKVHWKLPNPRELHPDISNLRYYAQNKLRHEYTQFSKSAQAIIKQAFRSDMFPNTRKKRINELYAILDESGKLSSCSQWLDAEFCSLKYLDFLAFIDRYQLCQRAIEAGVVISPDIRELPISMLGAKDDSPCLQITELAKHDDVDHLVNHYSQDRYSDGNGTLTNILGKYANLDVARRGAFSQILMEELGRNIAEHSGATHGWICTRLVSPNNVNSRTRSDPSVRSFRDYKEGFFEVIVCDNGKGLIAGVNDVLRKDNRSTVRKKYKCHEEQYDDVDLLDYVFDRLSSTKRDIAQLVHLESEKKVEAVLASSGLYWVWNVLRMNKGILSIHTNDMFAWYDFYGEGDNNKNDFFQRNCLKRESNISSCGTTLRLSFPFSNNFRGDKKHRGLTQKKQHSLFDSPSEIAETEKNKIITAW